MVTRLLCSTRRRDYCTDVSGYHGLDGQVTGRCKWKSVCYGCSGFGKFLVERRQLETLFASAECDSMIEYPLIHLFPISPLAKLTSNNISLSRQHSCDRTSITRFSTRQNDPRSVPSNIDEVCPRHAFSVSTSSTSIRTVGAV